jgi:hypothetical protein
MRGMSLCDLMITRGIMVLFPHSGHVAMVLAPYLRKNGFDADRSGTL